MRFRPNKSQEYSPLYEIRPDGRENINAPNDILATPYELKNAGYRSGLADRVERP